MNPDYTPPPPRTKRPVRGRAVSLFGVPAALFMTLAFVGEYRTEECAIIGGFFLVTAAVVYEAKALFPAIEGAIARRLADYAARSRIQADSFDGTWNNIRRTIEDIGKRITGIEAELRTLNEFRERIRSEVNARGGLGMGPLP